MKRFLTIVLILVVAGFAIALTVAFWPTTSTPIAAGDTSSETEVAKGLYVARAADCAACHTAGGGKPFAGGLPIASPIGTLYSTNITPDAKHGIGDYSLDDFDRAVRRGIAKDGHTLFPAMPYPDYAKFTDDDVRALYAYFKHGVAPVDVANHENDVPWPLSMRWPLALWRKAFAPSRAVVPFDATHYSDATLARGAYLVQVPGHCGSCHTPRAITLQEQATDEQGKAFLSGGGIIDGWLAVNLRGDAADGLGDWSVEDITQTLQTGRNRTHAVVGKPMNDVVVNSTEYLSDDDRTAIAVYLKSLKADGDAGAHATFKADPEVATALATADTADRGAQVYVDNCAACHRTSGEGAPGAIPAVAGNSTALAANPATLIRLVLEGSAMAATQTRPSNLGMPGFAWRLSDDDVAQLGTFVRRSWGNHASAVTADEVRKVREQVEKEGTQKSEAGDVASGGT